MVSIHASSREDATFVIPDMPLGIDVSIHASSREDATIGRIRQAGPGRFQSTRPRGRTRLSGGSVNKTNGVSIHASSREDATLKASRTLTAWRFNPRVLAGGRDMLYVILFTLV